MDLFSIYHNYLKQAVSIKSISADATFKPEINKMVEWLDNELSSIGFSVKIIEGYGNPIILAYLEKDQKYETVLLYGHYDVQPAKKEDGWDSDPFELAEDELKFYARGSMDNKGQFLIYVTAIRKLIQEKSLGKNITFLIEGNEETGSPKLSDMIKDHKESLMADFALISDGLTLEYPTIEASFRGNVNSQLIIHGPKNALHSGGFGGIVYNPINVLCGVIAKLAGDTGNTKILKSKITKPTTTDVIYLSDSEFDLKTFKDATGYKKPTVEGNYEINHAIGFENSVQITGITAGYTGEGFLNAIPTKAGCKINFRLNFGLNPDKVKSALTDFFKENIPKDVEYEFICKDLAYGAKLDLDNEYVNLVKEKLEEVYNNKVKYVFVGGTLPISHDIAEILKIPAVFAGLANADSNMHGANENFSKDYIKKALDFGYKLLHI